MYQVLIVAILFIVVSCNGGDDKKSEKEDIPYLNLFSISVQHLPLSCKNHNASSLKRADCESIGGTYNTTFVPSAYSCNNSIQSNNTCTNTGGALSEFCTVGAYVYTKTRTIDVDGVQACSDAGGTYSKKCIAPNSTTCTALGGIWAVSTPSHYVYSCSGYDVDSTTNCEIAGGKYSASRVYLAQDSANQINGKMFVSTTDITYSDILAIDEEIASFKVTVKLKSDSNLEYWTTDIIPSISKRVYREEVDAYNGFVVTFGKGPTKDMFDNGYFRLEIFE